MTSKQVEIKGLKFLGPDLTTIFNGLTTSYIPALSGWMDHPEPGEANGHACGPGGYHIMLRPSAIYAPAHWWPWHAHGQGILGQDSEKARVISIRLFPISPRLWWRYLRRFGHNAYLRGAYLRGAYLKRADLREADLSRADLSGAYLSGAYLSGAYLSGADLSGADLSGAYLREAGLSGADLSGADLSGAYLSGAYLSGAYLSGAYLSGADLSGADLSGAYLSGTIANKATIWPSAFDPKDIRIKND